MFSFKIFNKFFLFVLATQHLKQENKLNTIIENLKNNSSSSISDKPKRNYFQVIYFTSSHYLRVNNKKNQINLE